MRSTNKDTVGNHPSASYPTWYEAILKLMQALQLYYRSGIASNKTKIACKREQYKENQSRNEKWKTRTARWKRIRKPNKPTKQKRKQNTQGRRGKKIEMVGLQFLWLKMILWYVTPTADKNIYVKSIFFAFVSKTVNEKKAEVCLSGNGTSALWWLTHLCCTTDKWGFTALTLLLTWYDFHLLNWLTPDMIWKTGSDLETWSLLCPIPASSCPD